MIMMDITILLVCYSRCMFNNKIHKSINNTHILMVLKVKVNYYDKVYLKHCWLVSTNNISIFTNNDNGKKSINNTDIQRILKVKLNYYDKLYLKHCWLVSTNNISIFTKVNILVNIIWLFEYWNIISRHKSMNSLYIDIYKGFKKRLW
jgi:hypothetical protein